MGPAGNSVGKQESKAVYCLSALKIIFKNLGFLISPEAMWVLFVVYVFWLCYAASSQTRDQTRGPCSGRYRVLTTGLPGKSQPCGLNL